MRPARNQPPLPFRLPQVFQAPVQFLLRGGDRLLLADQPLERLAVIREVDIHQGLPRKGGIPRRRVVGVAQDLVPYG